MSLAPTPIRSLKAPIESPPSPAAPAGGNTVAQPPRRRPRIRGSVTLSVIEGCAALVVFTLWLVLFAAGILVDTRPYRTVISPSAVAAMESAGAPPAATASRPGFPEATSTTTSAAAASQQPFSAPASVDWNTLIVAWLVVLLAYLPLNLAWLCAAASALGMFGSRVNLSDDTEVSPTDNTSPYASAILRGFFVYLFMTSGLLLLDETPFSSPSPGQYIRLAGFLSLFSFVISYQPRLFTALVVSAFQRINVRDGSHDNDSAKGDTTLVARKEVTKKEEVIVQQPSEPADPDR